MIWDAILVLGSLLTAYSAINRARGARMLTRATRWPTADQAELGALIRSYIVSAAGYAIATAAMALALAARHA